LQNSVNPIKTRILLINQTFYPDESATAQYAADLSEDLNLIGYEVIILTSNRGYLIPDLKYPKVEYFKGCKIVRVASLTLPRKWKVARIIDAFFMNLALLFNCFRLKDFDYVICLTSPPLIGSFLVLLPKKKKGKVVHWAMDINPDQVIKAGWVKSGSLLARVLDYLQRNFYRTCFRIVVLDKYMRDLLIRKGIEAEKIKILPLWWDDTKLEVVSSEDNKFIQEYNLKGFKIIMYSGNHSLCHPLDALLKAAYICRVDPIYKFVFIGGGSRVQEVTDFKNKNELTNIMQLPYFPREELSFTLSAAWVHVVSLGQDFVGIIHPSKIYSILGLKKPFIALAPKVSSLADLAVESGLGLVIDPNDGEGFVAALQQIPSAILNDELTSRYRRSQVTSEFASLLKAN